MGWKPHIYTTALAAAAELGHEPCFILGGFNQDPLPAQVAALMAWGRSSVSPPRRALAGKAHEWTRHTSPQAAAIVRRVTLRWDLGIPLHAGIEVALDTGTPPTYRARERASSLAKEPVIGWGPAACAMAL